jgi:hypothetical protein
MAARKTTTRPPARKTAAPTASARRPAAPAKTPVEKARSAVAVVSAPTAKLPKVKADKLPRAPKSAKLHRKPVRDSFTMPEADFALIATLKARALAGQRETKKSELLRAGLHALAGLETAALVASLARLEPVKIGRPKKDR